MKLRQKVILLAVAPLLVALCVIALFVRQQAITLAQQQRSTIETAYLASKEAELHHYVEMAVHAISRQLVSGRTDAATLAEAKRILSDLSFGDDGYFFIYDMQGNNLMHPRQPELVGRNLWSLRDAAGAPTIQGLIARARSGGGLERYTWVKPSTGHAAPKLGYVVPIEQWGWVMGTGIYLDDVDAALAKVDVQQSRNIESTLWWIAVLAIVSAASVGSVGLALNIRESRVADAKLKVLAQRVVDSQEQERARLSRDLHDGISQSLVSIKLQLEAATIRLEGDAGQRAAATASVERSASAITSVLGEVRRISHDLRPALLDDLGLAAALAALAEESGTGVQFSSDSVDERLPVELATVLFRIAQEGLANSARHARASHTSMRLAQAGAALTLSISDDGIGFNPDDMALHPHRGIGLRNMSERMDAIGGTMEIVSNAAGTTLRACVSLGKS
ncbi:MAG: cache domain-containing protein [Pseudomonadota bacterium]|nr:cache domain-containing protein [Pseudomonadota bacterium]